MKKVYALTASAWALSLVARAEAQPLLLTESSLEPLQTRLATLQTCEEIRIEVEVVPGSAERHEVAGTVCARGAAADRTVQILLSGATYTRDYWDFPFESPRYSFVAAQTAAGFVTLNLDRIGVGDSDTPPAGEVTVATNAHVVHQIVQQLRSGTLSLPSLGDLRPARIVLAGHSLGAAVAAVEAATHHDVDGVILTGVLHAQGPQAFALASNLHPTALDPILSGLALPDGYLTTVPGTRAALFHHPDTSDPGVIALDELLKTGVTTGEFSDLADAAGATASIDVPVLLVVGDEDFTFCNPPSCSAGGALEDEQAFFAPEACLTALSLPRAAHALNLHRHAALWYATAALWTSLRVGVSATVPALVPCR
jgi:pimeloyl-ACP methyl ester carboxylesterase